MVKGKAQTKRNSQLSTYEGTSKAVMRHRGIAVDANYTKARFLTADHKKFAEEAAAALTPPESLNLFIITATLDRASQVLRRPIPAVAQPTPQA